MYSIFDENIGILLNDFLDQYKSGPVRAKPYRNKHKEFRQYINFLELENILRQDTSDPRRKIYTISCTGLYLSNSTLSQTIFESIDKISVLFRDALDASDEDFLDISVDAILHELNIDIATFMFNYQFLNDYTHFGGTTNLSDEGAIICVNEKITDFDNFSSIPEGMLKDRFPQDFDLGNLDKPRHGKSEYNARIRETILGAAIAALVASPEKCSTKGEGVVKGAKITKVIEDNAKSLFRETNDGKLPLEPRTVTEQINKWISKSRNIK